MLEVEVTRREDGKKEKVKVTLDALVCEKGRYPQNVSRNELDLSLNKAFATRNGTVLPDFFYEPSSEAYPHDLSLIVVARNKKTDQVIGGTVVETFEVRDDYGKALKINYISKVWVLEEYQRNGLMKHLLDETERNLKNDYPYALRTFDPTLDRKYAVWSDIGIEGTYLIRGKGFLTRKGKPRKKFPDGAYWMEVVARHLDNKPRSVRYPGDNTNGSVPPVQVTRYTPLPTRHYHA